MFDLAGGHRRLSERRKNMRCHFIAAHRKKRNTSKTIPFSASERKMDCIHSRKPRMNSSELLFEPGNAKAPRLFFRYPPTTEKHRGVRVDVSYISPRPVRTPPVFPLPPGGWVAHLIMLDDSLSYSAPPSLMAQAAGQRQPHQPTIKRPGSAYRALPGLML